MSNRHAVTRRLVQRLPHGVKRYLAGPYNRVQSVRADRAFQQRSIEPAEPLGDAPEHVVCVVIDALRADALGKHTPFLTAQHVGDLLTTSSWTFPAVTSLVTGQYPHEHGAMRQSDRSERGATDLLLPPELPHDRLTLPEVFAGAGYETYGGFGFQMPFFAIGGRFGTHALYDDMAAETVIADYLEWLETTAGPTFAYLHLGDLHEPVDPPRAYWERHNVDPSIDRIRRWRYEIDPAPGPAGERYRAHRRRLYHAATEYVDDCLRDLHAQLSSHEDVVVLCTADHGEGLWEWTAFDAEHFEDSRPAHGVDHGGTPYEALTRVPLAVSGLDCETVDRASLVDIAPTLLTELGLGDTLDTSGYPLQMPIPADRISIVEASRYGHEKKAAYLDEWKLIVSEGDDRRLGFQLPEETPTPIPEAVQRKLTAALPPWPDGSHPGRAVSGIARDRLEQLGYV